VAVISGIELLAIAGNHHAKRSYALRLNDSILVLIRSAPIPRWQVFSKAIMPPHLDLPFPAMHAGGDGVVD